MALDTNVKDDWLPADGITNEDLNRIERNTQSLEDTKIEEGGSGSLDSLTIDTLTPNAITSFTVTLSGGSTYAIPPGFYMIYPNGASANDYTITFTYSASTFNYKYSADPKGSFLFTNANYPATITAVTPTTIRLQKVM